VVLVSTQFQYLGARSTPFGGLAWAPKLKRPKLGNRRRFYSAFFLFSSIQAWIDNKKEGFNNVAMLPLRVVNRSVKIQLCKKLNSIQKMTIGVNKNYIIECFICQERIFEKSLMMYEVLQANNWKLYYHPQIIDYYRCSSRTHCWQHNRSFVLFNKRAIVPLSSTTYILQPNQLKNGLQL
jgi:hypothetical protein